jgi:hypothetical protein
LSADAIYAFAKANAVTHFATLKVGLIGRHDINITRDLLEPISVLMKEFARDRCMIPRRAPLRPEHFPFLCGVVEQFDYRGARDPHFHFFMKLDPGEEPRCRGLFRQRWGKDATKGGERLPALAFPAGTEADMKSIMLPEIVPYTPGTPPRTVVKRGKSGPERHTVRPSFDLQLLQADWQGAARYMVKQPCTDLIVHTHLLDL